LAPEAPFSDLDVELGRQLVSTPSKKIAADFKRFPHIDPDSSDPSRRRRITIIVAKKLFMLMVEQ
jgi:hypothetical protein